MAKQLFLIRHADASQKEARQEDKTRELSQAGVKDAMHMGAWLREQQFSFDFFATSSALRAEQTASMIAEMMKTGARIRSEDALYEASPQLFLNYINNLEDAFQHVALVGHNPVISHLAEHLTKAEIGDMVPGSVAIIKFDIGSWKEVSENTGTLFKLVAPEMINKY